MLHFDTRILHLYSFAQSKPRETGGRRATKLIKTGTMTMVLLFYMLVEPPKNIHFLWRLFLTRTALGPAFRCFFRNSCAPGSYPEAAMLVLLRGFILSLAMGMLCFPAYAEEVSKKQLKSLDEQVPGDQDRYAQYRGANAFARRETAVSIRHSGCPLCVAGQRGEISARFHRDPA